MQVVDHVELRLIRHEVHNQAVIVVVALCDDLVEPPRREPPQRIVQLCFEHSNRVWLHQSAFFTPTTLPARLSTSVLIGLSACPP